MFKYVCVIQKDITHSIVQILSKVVRDMEMKSIKEIKGMISDRRTGEEKQVQNIPSEIAKAEDGYRSACLASRDAIRELGRAVYEAEKDISGSQYRVNIEKIAQSFENEKLWQLYGLSIEGKTLCESCGSVITSDSAFCNKCGATVPQWDFSAIIGDAPMQETATTTGMYPNCGSPLPDGAVFCEKCGTKIEATSRADTASNEATVAQKNVCPTCGAPLVDGAVFCEKCGTKI